jgi:hypothetical protein
MQKIFGNKNRHFKQNWNSENLTAQKLHLGNHFSILKQKFLYALQNQKENCYTSCKTN